ncbi:competence protein CoiA [Clostridium perfringens]|uniref:competence protein CoiA n=1 Tax=Clostridium perfringens TaxID=1502 RepID=UPI0023415763|nr:competence protein CoiA family protein [Clostridium perfringens]MDC4245542.1 hypothetical protein [Clostridium perfringens]
MITCQVGKKKINTFSYAPKQLREWSNKGLLKCPVCGSRMIYNHGEFKIPHFKHEKNCDCPDIYSEGVTEEHIKGIELLHNWLKKQEGVTNIELEKWIPETKQRPDIYFEYEDKPYVIEFQCSPIATKFLERRELYRLNEINDIWILGCNKYNVNTVLGKELDLNEWSQQFYKSKAIECELYNQDYFTFYLDVKLEMMIEIHNENKENENYRRGFYGVLYKECLDNVVLHEHILNKKTFNKERHRYKVIQKLKRLKRKKEKEIKFQNFQKEELTPTLIKYLNILEKKNYSITINNDEQCAYFKNKNRNIFKVKDKKELDKRIDKSEKDFFIKNMLKKVCNDENYVNIIFYCIHKRHLHFDVREDLYSPCIKVKCLFGDKINIEEELICTANIKEVFSNIYKKLTDESNKIYYIYDWIETFVENKQCNINQLFPIYNNNKNYFIETDISYNTKNNVEFLKLSYQFIRYKKRGRYDELNKVINIYVYHDYIKFKGDKYGFKNKEELKILLDKFICDNIRKIRYGGNDNEQTISK